jgi:hypothetical protein
MAVPDFRVPASTQLTSRHSVQVLTNVNLCVCLIKHDAKKTYGGVQA